MIGWWARRSLRARLMVIGLLGLAVAQAVGSVALYAALSVAGRHDLDGRAQATAQQVADLVTSGRLPNPIPVTGSESVQVVDATRPGAQRLGERRPAHPVADTERTCPGPLVPGHRPGLATRHELEPAGVCRPGRPLPPARRS